MDKNSSSRNWGITEEWNESWECWGRRKQKRLTVGRTRGRRTRLKKGAVGGFDVPTSYLILCAQGRYDSRLMMLGGRRYVCRMYMWQARCTIAN